MVIDLNLIKKGASPTENHRIRASPTRLTEITNAPLSLIKGGMAIKHLNKISRSRRLKNINKLHVKVSGGRTQQNKDISTERN